MYLRETSWCKLTSEHDYIAIVLNIMYLLNAACMNVMCVGRLINEPH